MDNYMRKKNINKEKDKIDTVELIGYITEIDLENKILKANFVEFDEERIIKFDSEIPEWLLENIPFSCRIDERDFYENEFYISDPKPIGCPYLNIEE